jgi:predicted DNA-binding transcriptional regulator
MATVDDYVVDVLMRDLVGHDRKPVSFLVYLWLTAQTRSGRAMRVSFQEMAESIGVSKSAAQTAVRWLVRRKLLTATKTTATAVPCYTVMTPWKDPARRGRG